MKKEKSNLMQGLGKKISKEEFEKDNSIHTFSESYDTNKKDLLNKIKLKDNIKSATRRKAFIAAACVALLCIPASVFAANAVIEGLRVNKEQTNKYAVEYNFENDATEGNVKSELYHSNVKLQYGYLPEGYKEEQPNSDKFSLNGSWYSNQNMSVLLNGVDDKSKFSFANVLETTDITIINNKASLIHLNSTDKKDFSKILLVFYNDYGYTLQIYAQEGVSDDEIIKVAENLQLVQCSKDEAISFSIMPSTVATNPLPTTTSPTATINVNDSDFLTMDTPFKGINTTEYNSTDLTYIVENVEIRDSIKDLPISGFGYEYENVQQFVDNDGKLLPFIQKEIVKGDGKTSVDTIVGETSSDLKLIYVTMKVKNTSDNLVDHVKINPQICCLVSNNGALSLPKDLRYSGQPAFGEGWSIYCSSSTMYDENPNSADMQSLMQRYSIEPQEEFEYHVAYIVDSANMNNMILFFNSRGKIIINDTQQTIIKLY